MGRMMLVIVGGIGFGLAHRPLSPHPNPLPPSGRGDLCIVDGGFSWCFGGVE